MNILNNLTGNLLISHPANCENYFSRSVILLVQHTSQGSWGVVVNRRAKTVSMQSVMNTIGIEYSGLEPVYIGGPIETSRVHIIHTLDWISSGTLSITDDIGITGDMSILAAISKGMGPAKFKTGVGLVLWGPGQLEQEQQNMSLKAGQSWLTIPATVDLCLSESGDKQWQRSIDTVITQQVSELF